MYNFLHFTVLFFFMCLVFTKFCFFFMKTFPWNPQNTNCSFQRKISNTYKAFIFAFVFASVEKNNCDGGLTIKRIEKSKGKKKNAKIEEKKRRKNIFFEIWGALIIFTQANFSHSKTIFNSNVSQCGAQVSGKTFYKNWSKLWQQTGLKEKNDTKKWNSLFFFRGATPRNPGCRKKIKTIAKSGVLLPGFLFLFYFWENPSENRFSSEIFH